MLQRCLIVGLCLLPFVACAGEIPEEKVKADIKAAKANNPKLFAKLGGTWRTQLNKSGLKGKELTEAKKELEKTIKNPPALPFLTSSHEFADGMWGCPVELRFKVEQVIDEDEFIGKPYYLTPSNVRGILQENMGKLTYVKGFPTTGLRDNADTTIGGTFTRDKHTVVKVGTITYETAIGGSNTIALIEPMNVDAYADDIWPEKTEPEPKKAEPKKK